MALDYDFYIGGLGFNLATSTDRPYERATAQFRKDQADTTATVGDQSLTGWWTRGQLSFHKGAGVRYYEVLGDSDDSIEGRYHQALAVDPFSIPGEVGLSREMSTPEALAGTPLDGVPWAFGLLVLQVGGDVFSVAADGSITDQSPASGTPLYLASDDTRAWVVFDTEIARLVDTASYTTIVTAGVGVSFVRAWWMKGRLFAVDANGLWYTASGTSASTLNTSDAFWASDQSGDPGWVAAEAPASVYLAKGRTIYSISLDATGLVPTVDFAGIAAQVPVGETISGIGYYLGFLIILTNAGVRVAAVGTDGSLDLGPLVIEGNFTGSARMASEGNGVYLLGPDELGTSTQMYQLNLVDLIAEVQPSYTTVATIIGSSSDDGGGVVRASTGELYAYVPDGVSIRGGDLAAGGTLETGYHRLGTLDPKAFRYLRVKTTGTEGTIDVNVVIPGDAPIYVGSVTAGDSADFDLSTSPVLAEPLEYVSILFGFNRGAGGTGPTLLGYQLKALPVPKRQRMIRVPLMLFDSEQNRSEQIMRADPWVRLTALEALEESNAVVTFEDKETGETGSGYIEAIEVSRTAPATRPGGFGGYIYVTIRRL